MTARYTQDNQCPLCAQILRYDSNGDDYCECWDDPDNSDWFDEEHVSQDIQEQIPQFPEYDSEI